MACSARLRMTYSLRSKDMRSLMVALRSMNTCRTTGMAERAVSPSWLPSVGTVRQPNTRWPSAAQMASKRRSKSARSTSSAGRNSIPTP